MITRVGTWRSQAGRSTYEEAYRTVLRSLPEPSRTLDVPTDFGTVRAYEWAADGAGAPVLLLPGKASGAPMWAENLPFWIGRRTMIAADAIGDAGLSTQSRPLASFDDQAEWPAQLITGLGLDRAHTVGHNFGGANAAIHALRERTPLSIMIETGAAQFDGCDPTPGRVLAGRHAFPAHAEEGGSGAGPAGLLGRGALTPC